MTDNISTEQRILDSAQSLIQRKGYNGFSYKDIAAEINIKTSSIHYHFSTKKELVESLFERYMQTFFGLLDDIASRNKSSVDKLRGLCSLFEETALSGKFCMCGSLAVVHYAVPDTVNLKVKTFAETTEAWIEKVLLEGMASGEVVIRTTAKEHASILFAALEGALLLCHVSESGLDSFHQTVSGLISSTQA